MENLDTYYRKLYENFMNVLKASENSPISTQHLISATGVDRIVVETLLSRMVNDGVLKTVHRSDGAHQFIYRTNLKLGSQGETPVAALPQRMAGGQSPLK
ncbi:hypothetical protein [Undibacterium rugosum]|uniref:Uncharacterized protein n=1 Tax=Undibacterium rugosum TaxID=2762291 RepID=A0A923I7U5_9BURK|nr:hypothetical protein [Undibacterium rugosum]MBC3937226.1 hypothetical protein [Undibacterium rugosum]MBR7779293.1 hypothetical protein [Undibacterium rugosum]